MPEIPRHQTIPAHELRNGDLMRIGVSTNYVLVHSTERVKGGVRVRIYNGDKPADNGGFFIRLNKPVQLSMRDTRP